MFLLFKRRLNEYVFYFCMVNVYRLKGLGQAFLGNFRTDQMVIELTKI